MEVVRQAILQMGLHRSFSATRQSRHTAAVRCSGVPCTDQASSCRLCLKPTTRRARAPSSEATQCEQSKCIIPMESYARHKKPHTCLQSNLDSQAICQSIKHDGRPGLCESNGLTVDQDNGRNTVGRLWRLDCAWRVLRTGGERPTASLAGGNGCDLLGRTLLPCRASLGNGGHGGSYKVVSANTHASYYRVQAEMFRTWSILAASTVAAQSGSRR